MVAVLSERRKTGIARAAEERRASGSVDVIAHLSGLRSRPAAVLESRALCGAA
jgi:hypothetical protein